MNTPAQTLSATAARSGEVTAAADAAGIGDRPLRVLLVCEDIPGASLGGLARHVVALGNALIDAGHAVTLMGRQAPQFDGRAEPTGFRGPFIAGFPDPFQGWKEHAVGAFNPWKRPHFARRLAQAIVERAADFDVVHYHGHLPMVGRYVPGHIRFLQTRHDQGSDCITQTRLRGDQVCREINPRACAGCIHPAPGLLRTALSAAAVRRYRRETAEAFVTHPVVFVSRFLLDNYRRAVPDAPGIQAHVVHNFVDEAGLRAIAAGVNAGADVESPARFTVHLAGRIEPAKGIAALCELLAPRMPAHWRVQLFGDGPERAHLAGLGLPGITLHGHQPLATVVAAAAAGQVTVVPSVWEEPCGTVILEALRLGKPCYALRRGGTPELARYGAPGQLRLFDSLPALVDALLASGEQPNPPAGGEPADVGARLPELLALYRQAVPAVAEART